MKKKFIALTGALVLTVSVAATAFAAAPMGYGLGNGNGMCGAGYYSLMRDADGSFLDKDAFEANLDKAIEDGYISAEDRDFYIERYEYCSVYGGGFGGGGCGRGRGWAMTR